MTPLAYVLLLAHIAVNSFLLGKEFYFTMTEGSTLARIFRTTVCIVFGWLIVVIAIALVEWSGFADEENDNI